MFAEILDRQSASSPQSSSPSRGRWREDILSRLQPILQSSSSILLGGLPAVSTCKLSSSKYYQRPSPSTGDELCLCSNFNHTGQAKERQGWRVSRYIQFSTNLQRSHAHSNHLEGLQRQNCLPKSKKTTTRRSNSLSEISDIILAVVITLPMERPPCRL